jgi:hypothetical protein
MLRRSDNNGGLIRERGLAARRHGILGEEMRLSFVRMGPAALEMVELRQWNVKEDGTIGPTSHGLRIPRDMAGWLLSC